MQSRDAGSCFTERAKSPQKHMYDLGKKKHCVVLHCCMMTKKDKLVVCGEREERKKTAGRGKKETLKTDELPLLKHRAEAPTFSPFSTVALARARS